MQSHEVIMIITLVQLTIIIMIACVGTVAKEIIPYSLKFSRVKFFVDFRKYPRKF